MARWRRRSRGESRRQYWERTPGPTDALTGYAPGGSGLVDGRIPGEVFPDEIDPAWAEGDGGGAATADEPAEQADEPRRPET